MIDRTSIADLLVAAQHFASSLSHDAVLVAVVQQRSHVFASMERFFLMARDASEYFAVEELEAASARLGLKTEKDTFDR